MDTETEHPPGRLVDLYGRPWIWSSDGYRLDTFGMDPADVEAVVAQGVPIAAYAGRHTPGLPYGDLLAVHADAVPFRPVERDNGDDLYDVLMNAEHDAAYVLAHALVNVDRITEIMSFGPFRLMIAGRPGSWETSALNRLLDFGRIFPERSSNPHVVRLVHLILPWVLGRDTYTEVAESIAAVFSRVTDERGGFHTGYFHTPHGLAELAGPGFWGWITSLADHHYERCNSECDDGFEPDDGLGYGL